MYDIGQREALSYYDQRKINLGHHCMYADSCKYNLYRYQMFEMRDCSIILGMLRNDMENLFAIT